MTRSTGTEHDTEAANAARFWRFWTATTVSSLGTGVTTVALPLIAVSTLHASSFEVGLVVAATYAAWILVGLPAGPIVSQWPLRRTQVSMDLIRFAVLGSVPVAALLDWLSLVQVVLVALIVGICSVPFDVANSTFIVSIVPRDELAARNATLSASVSASQLAGPSLGGLLVQWLGASLAVIIDSVSYLVSAVLLYRMPEVPPDPARRAERRSIWQEIRDGISYVRAHPSIRSTTINVTIINFVSGGVMVLMPLFLVRVLDAPAFVVGVLYACEGVGGLAGSALVPWSARRGSATALRQASLACRLFALLMPAAPRHLVGYVLFGLGLAGFSAGVVVLALLSRTHRQIATPRALLPHVMATVKFVSWSVIPVGGVAAGALASVFGVRTTLWGSCLLLLAAPIVLALGPIRHVRVLPLPEDASGVG